MANKQYLIEIAVGNTKLKSSLKKALEDPSVQKELGILGEGITEHLEKDVGKAASILGKVDWASLLGKKDFEDLQQLVAKTVSANKDMIKSFIKSGDTQGIRDTIELVSELGKELKAINPDETVAGLTRSMNSFITTLKPISDTLNGMVNGSQRFAGALQNLLDNFDTTTINKNIKETSDIVANTLKAMNTKSAKNALKTMFEEAYGSAEKMEDALLSSDAMNAYLSKFETAKSIAEEMNRLMKESEKGVRDIKGRLIYKQQLEGLQGKLAPMIPTLDGSVIKKEAKTISKDLDVTIEEITDKLEKSFNKTIEDKLSSIKVKIDLPTEEQLISDINKVIEKVNQKGTSTLKLVGAESAINTAQKQILENTKKWHDDMKTYLKFDKKEDITLDLGVKMREIGSNIGEQMQRSIEEYFDNPENKVSIPVELIISDKNKAILEGSNVTVVGGGGGGEITAESLAKALTTPIEVKVQEKKEKQRLDDKLISIDREGQFAQEIIDAFEGIFKLVERGGKNAKSVGQFFNLKGINLEELSKLSGGIRDNEIISAFESLLESGDASLLDQVQKLTTGSTKSRAIIELRDLIQDSVLRFDLKQISTQEDVKRRHIRNLVEEDYIPRSTAQESLYKIRNTNAKNYQLPTVEELNKLMEDLPQVWGELGKDFLPALEALKKLRSEITDPTNATEIQRFKGYAEEFASNTNQLYREMSDVMRGYKIGIFNKGHNKHDSYYDYAVKGGVFSGSKLSTNLDKVDYFELYDDPSGYFSRGNRKDAMDNASRFDRYQLRRDARNAPYRTREPKRTKISAEDIEIKKFEPKTRVDEEINEINFQKGFTNSRAKAIEEARVAEELRKQQLETDKKRRTVLKGQRTKNENKIKETENLLRIAKEVTKWVLEHDRDSVFYFEKRRSVEKQESDTNDRLVKLKEKKEQLNKEIVGLDERISKNSIKPPNADEIQSMMNEINVIDEKIEVAKKQANELDEWVSENFKEEKKTNIDYTKSQKNNQNKNKDKKNWVYTLNQLLNEKDRTKLSSLTGMNKKDVKVVSSLLHNREIYQLINSGLSLQKNSYLEDIVKHRLQTYQNGLNKIDEFLLKYKDQTLRYVEDDPDLIEFMKDYDVKRMLAGTFNGSQEEENAIKSKIDEFKTRMSKAGKSYILDYIDMWSNKNLRELMEDNGIKRRTVTDAKGSSILMEFYNKILKGGFGKRDEAYQYLENEREKYKQNIEKDELSLENIIVSKYNQTEIGDTEDLSASNELKDKYKKHISKWLYTIQDNMYSVLFGELDDKDAALKTKKNDELRNIVISAAEKYRKLFGEELLTEFQKEFLQKTSGEYNDFKNRQVYSLNNQREEKQASTEKIVIQKAGLLKQRRFDLLKNISNRANNGEDTTSLEKALSEVENELINYYDELPYLLQNEFESDLLNAKNATDEEWKKFRENATKRQSEYEAEKYLELKVKKKALLDEISVKTKKGESTSNLEEQLKNINKELTQYEITASRMEDTKKSIFPDDASTRAIQVYNIEMKKLVELLHEKEYLEAKDKDTSDINIKIARQKRKTYNNIKQRVNEDKKIDAEYDPKTQASKFIEETDADLYRLQQAESDARRRLNDANSRLATIQGDKYYNSTLYKNRIESLKDADIDKYVRSDEYRTERDKGLAQVDRELGAYLAEELGEDVAKQVVWELSKNKDVANIDSIITSEDEISELEKQYLKEYLNKRNKLSAELFENSGDKIKSDTIKARIKALDSEVQNNWPVGGMGNTSRLIDNAFSKTAKQTRQDYINSDEYKKKLEEAKKIREEQISKNLASDEEIRNIKVQESWNRTRKDIKALRRANMANSEELRNAVFAEAEKAGMRDSSEYRRSIVEKVREDLIQQRIDIGKKEQKEANNEYYNKARELRSKLSPEMYQKLDAEVDKKVYELIMKKIQGLIGDKKDLLGGLYEEREKLIKTHVGSIIERRRESLNMEQTGLYTPMDGGKTINIREELEKELAHEVAFYEQRYIEASGKLSALQHQRSSAMSFGELGTTEVDNPEISRIRAEAEASLSAEKAKQINLTEKLTNLVAQNANPQLINSVAAALSATEKEIGRLTLLIEGASSALSIRQEAKDAAEAEKKLTPEKLRLWYIDQIQKQKGFMENGTDKQKEKAPAIIEKMEQKLAYIENKIEESKPEAEKPKTILDMITNSIRDGLANVTSGGTVNLDASLYNIATETTLQEILRLLGGNGAVDYANQLKSGLEKYRPRNEGKSFEGSKYRSNGSTTNKKQRKNNSLDKLNEEGQRIYGELDAEAKAFIFSLKNGRKEYDDNFDFVKAIKEQAKVVRSKTKGDLEYIKEQTKLTVLYQDYYGKTFGKGKKKKGQPSQSTWATQGELGKIDDLEDLLLFKYKRADALVGLNYGIEGITQVDDVVSESKPQKNTKKKTTKKKSIPDAVTSDDNQVVNKIMANELEARGITNIDEEDMSDIIKSVNELILNLTHGDGLGRDIDDNILSTKGETSQVLYDAIVDGYKAAASGDKIFAETSYSLDELGNVVDVKRGTMLNSAPPEFASVFGHTHPSDKLFGSNDFKSAAAGKGIIDVLELITPLNKYKISGLKNINPDELAKKFAELAVIAQKFENLPSSIYNATMKSAILAQGLNLTETPMNIDPSNNFQLVRNASVLQSVSNHELPLAPFEKVLYSFVTELKDIGYQFDKGSPLDQLVKSIITIQQTKYNSAFEKEWDIEGLRPLIEEVFGVNPLAQINQKDRDMLTQISDKVPYLRLEIDDRGVELAGYGKQLFSDGKNLSGKEAYKSDDGLGRDNGAKKDKKYRKYNNAVSVGYDRIQKLQKIRESGTTGPASTGVLLRSNSIVWDKIKENNFFNNIPEDGLQRFSKINEVVTATVGEILQALGVTEQQLIQQLQDVRNATGGNFKSNGYDSGWNHFATYDESGKKHPMQKNNGLTYKVYAAFENIEDLNENIVSSIMKELSDAGFKGRLKTTSGSTSMDDKLNAIVNTDQLVIHGSSKKDQEIAYNVLKKMGLNLSYLSGGIDTPDGSFTETLSKNAIDKYVKIQKKKIQVEPEVKPGAVAEEVRENAESTPPTVEVKPEVKPGAVDKEVKENKKSTRSTTNENSNTTYVNSKNTNNPASDNKMPYDIDPDSLIGRLQNTVGGSTKPLAEQATLALVLTTLQEISNKIPTIGKSGVKSSAQNLLEEFQKMAMGSSMDGKERVAFFDSVNGVMSPALSGTAYSISQDLINTLSGPYGADKGYRSRIHTHADSDQTWFSKKDLNYFKDNIGDFNADSIKQEILLTNDTITIFDMTMVETAEKAKQAIDILINAGSNIDNIVLEKLANLGARYQSKDFGSIGAKGLMDLIGVKNYKNDGKKKGAVANPEVALKGLESYAKSDADKRNSKYVFNSFDGETLKYQLVDIEGHISKVILVWDELEKKVRVVSDTSTSSMDAITRKIQQYHDEIKNAQNEKLLSDGDDADFIAAQKEVDKIIKQIETEDLSGQKLSEAIDALDVARKKLAEEGKKLHKLIAKNDKLRNGTSEVKSAITQGTKVRSLVGDLIQTDEQDGLQLFNFSDDAPKYLQDYILQYNDLVRVQQQYIKDGQINNPKIQDALKVQANKVKELGMEAMTAYQKTLNLQEQSDKWESQKYTDRAGKEHSLGGSKYVGFQGVNRATMLQYAKEVLGADLASAKLNTTTGKLTGVLRKNNRVVADMAVVYDESTGKLHLFQEKERESLSGLPGFMNALKAKSKAIAQYLMSMTSIYRVLGEIRQGIQYVKEIDLALTELKKVTDETDETYEKFLDTASKTASKVGSTIKDVVSSTADWARLGYSIQEAAQLAESTQILMNVSEFTDISTATDSLISSIQAFKYTAEESMDVVDILNTIGNNYAISTADLAQSLTKSSGSLVAANGTLEEAVALTATANTIIQDADVVGEWLADFKSGYIS